MESRIRSLTARIASAYIANNDVSANQLPSLIRNVHQALATVEPTPAEPVKAEPFMAMKESVFADHILCLDCGGSFKILKRHILIDHQMTPDEHRAKWDLPPSYPMVAAEYATLRSKYAKDTGLGRKVETPPRRKPDRPTPR